jgi:hypothetical protein
VDLLLVAPKVRRAEHRLKATSVHEPLREAIILA